MSIRGQLRKEAQISDFSFISRNLADLEASKTIRCVRLELVGKERTPIFDTYYKGNCDTFDFFLGGSTVTETLKSVNGDSFDLRFKTVNHLVFYAALWMLRIFGLFATVGLFYYLFLKRKNQEEMLTLKIQHANEIYQAAKQISHDIRSPLAALSMVVASLKDLPEDKRLITRNATQRINDIANQLLQQNRSFTVPTSEHDELNRVTEPILLVGLLDSILSEKRVQYRERMEIDIQGDLNDGFGLFASINPIEFSRAISNLINNSVEAFLGPGRITIGIHRHNELVQLMISDNGKGIPEHVLARLGDPGVSYGKDEFQSSGSGLGVYHAKKTIESAGGSMSIQSRLGHGTSITLSLPKAETPRWFVDKITIPSDSILVSVDDDQTIHQIWSERIMSCDQMSEIRHISFSSCEQFENWVSLNQDQVSKFFVDYEFLGQALNGLDVIERTRIETKAILVTSRFDESHIRLRASKLGVRILPKALAPFVPIDIEKKAMKCHAVLIDDDDLVNRPIETNTSPMKISTEKNRYDLCLIDDDQALIGVVWAMEAASKGLKIKLFATPQDFVAEADKIDPQTPIYVDVSLGNGVNGLDVAHDIHKMGFTEINLATGYHADSMTVPPFIRRVVGKGFPEN